MSNVNVLVAIDLEMNQPSNKIIQIGAAIGVLDTGTVIDSFGTYVDPGEPIDDFIINLTGITDEVIAAKAVSLLEGYGKLVEFVTKYKASITPVTWGSGDNELLSRQLKLAAGEYIFTRRSIDSKTVHTFLSNIQGKMPHGGLGKSMKNWGLDFIGKQHDATDDAYNTMRLYMKMINSERGIRRAVTDAAPLTKFPKN